MANLAEKKRGYPSKLMSSLRDLLSAQEILALRNIRLGYLQYFFAFPLAMIFINTQDFLLGDGIHVHGLAQTTITFISFVIGAIIMFAFSNETNISVISKISAFITVAGFIPWLFLPDGYPSLVCAVVFMAGIGGCVSSSSFSFVFVLNNPERFFGSALMLLVIELVGLGIGFIPIHTIARKSFALILIAAISICVYLSRNQDFVRAGGKTVNKFDMSIWLVLFILFAYFTIRITGFYAPAFQHPSAAQLWDVLALILILLCIILQVVFKFSVWTMCNVFFLTAIMSHVMWYLKLFKLAFMFSELKEVGFYISFYLVGCVTNKFCDFRMHKRLILVCMAMIGVLYVGIDLLHTMMFTQSIAVVAASVLFIIFLLLSPAYSQYLFFADWSKEFRLTYMSCLAKDSTQAGTAEEKQLLRLEDTHLSPREKQVVLLLLQGLTLRQVAPELGLTVSTVSTYSKAIYKKLGINSRAELFMLFGHQRADGSSATTRKE
ncbi:MAG: helix-turn-helix transcriptional regulator [Desulfitobacterium sp.]